MTIVLPTPQVLEISGADCISFAHAQFCNDVIALARGHWQWNAWLSAQGRVRYFFMLLRDADDRLRLLLRGGDAQAMCAELTRFVFRAKVSLSASAGMQALGCDAGETQAVLGALPDNAETIVHDGTIGLRLPGPGPRWLSLSARQSSVASVVSDEAVNHWYLDDIRAGLPLLAPALQNQLLPQWLGLGRLGAINVGKGCYPGQEIMARLHFKGGNKRGLYRIQFDCAVLPAPAAALFVADATTEGGNIVMTAWEAGNRAEALASLADAAATGPLRSDAATVANIKVISGFA
jgi:folate-binding protein YgfZ